MKRLCLLQFASRHRTLVCSTLVLISGCVTTKRTVSSHEIIQFYSDVSLGREKTIAASIRKYPELVNVQYPDEYVRDSPLAIAVDYDGINIIRLLLDHGAMVGTRDDYGFTPLHSARSSQAVDLLLAHGATMEATNRYGETVLLTALRGKTIDRGSSEYPEKRKPLAVYLIQRGANVRVHDSSGDTPMHYAAAMGRSDVVQMLIARGAELNGTNSAGKTPISIAEEKGHSQVLEMLVKIATQK